MRSKLIICAYLLPILSAPFAMDSNSVAALSPPSHIPENAHGNYYNTGWTCNKGYRRSGHQCLRVDLPKHASLSYNGHSWTCNKGYKKRSQSCVAMTENEIQKQNELEAQVRAMILRRRLRGVSGDDCEREDETGSKVCVEVTDRNIDCDEDYAARHYDDCSVNIDYDVKTDYRGDSELETDVECDVDIKYGGRNTYFMHPASDSQDDSHDLSSYDDESYSMQIDFSFSTSQEVTVAKITSVSCEITDVDLD
ncbi:MAG: hypothetical protein ACREBW_09265 [Candidatus Micrarchaeaceae archaeon]